MRPTLPSLFVASAFGLACALTAPQARAQVFADFEIDLNGLEWGRFTVVLDHNSSPHASANFIRLAQGLTPWIDSNTGLVKAGPFYNGLSFHSGIADVELAGGSPTGNGRDGPGYAFRDDLRLPPTQFSMFMDNDGPNTNGSRFFINLLANLNPVIRPGNYTKFGVVQTTTNPPGQNGRFNVLTMSRGGNSGAYSINSVNIRYVGVDATAFRFLVNQGTDPVLSLLPSIRQATFTFRRTGGATFLDWDESSGSVLRLWQSSNLRNWLGPATTLNAPGSTSFGFDITPSIQLQPKGFYRGGVADYSQWPSTERPLRGSFIQTNFFDPNLGGSLTSTYAFDATGRAGTYASPLGSGTFTVNNFATSGPYSTGLDLVPESGNQPAYRLTLHYDLAWTSTIPALALPVTANPSRVTGANLVAPGTKLVGGQWTYTAEP